MLPRAENSGRRTGYVSAAVAEDHARLAGAKAYVAGPPAMVDASLSVLINRGVPARDIHADVFFTPEDKAAQLRKHDEHRGCSCRHRRLDQDDPVL